MNDLHHNKFNVLPKVILIGASTGGVDALLKIIRHFSSHCPPTLIVQHTGRNFVKSLINLLNRSTQAHVQEAVDGAPLRAGHIYLAPNDQVHLCLSFRNAPQICLCEDDAMNGHRPSIDALFLSACDYADHVCAALLTGMGRDGAHGLLGLYKAGAVTIAQDKATSIVYGMPRIATEIGAVSEQLPVEQIGPRLLRGYVGRVK